MKRLLIAALLLPLPLTFLWPALAGAQTLCAPISGLSGVQDRSIDLPNGSFLVLNSRGCVRVTDAGTKAWLKTQGYVEYLDGQAALVPTTAALKALATTGRPANDPVIKVGWYAAGDMPATGYYLVLSPCDLGGGNGDGGSEFPANDNPYCWHMDQGTQLNALVFGAVNDLVVYTPTVTTSNSNGNVIVDTGTFKAADVGANITIYGANSGMRGPTYEGVIDAVTNTTHFHVTPNPAVALAAVAATRIAYSHASGNAAAILNEVKYGCSTNNPQLVSWVDVSLADTKFGLTGPIVPDCPGGTGGIHLINGTLMPLATGSLSCLTDGLLELGRTDTRSDVENVTFDLNFLPVNGYYQTSAGSPRVFRESRIQRWQGSCASHVVTATGSATSNILTVTNSAGITQGMISHGNTANNIPNIASVVAVPDATHVIISMRPTGTLTNASITFYNDGNGEVFTAATNNGATHHHVIVTESTGNDPANLYGYDLFSPGGHDVQLDSGAYVGGAAVLFIGGGSSGWRFINTEFNETAFTSPVANAASVILADGSGVFTCSACAFDGGGIQVFVAGGAAGLTSGVILSLPRAVPNNSITLTPNSLVQAWTDIAGSNQSNLSGDGANLLGGLAYFGFVTEGAGSWFNLPNLDYGGQHANNLLDALPTPVTNKVFAASDCHAIYHNAAFAADKPVLNAQSPIGCKINFVSRLADTALLPATGATINGVGPPTTLALTQYVLTICEVGRNVDGVSAEWSCK